MQSTEEGFGPVNRPPRTKGRTDKPEGGTHSNTRTAAQQQRPQCFFLIIQESTSSEQAGPTQ